MIFIKNCRMKVLLYIISYELLLSKMEFCGISRKANNLIKSYLQNRYQRVLVDIDSK